MTNEEALDYLYDHAGNVLFVNYDDVSDAIPKEQIDEMYKKGMLPKPAYSYDSIYLVMLYRRES